MFRFLERVKVARPAPHAGRRGHPGDAPGQRRRAENDGRGAGRRRHYRKPGRAFSVGLEDAEDIAEDLLQAVAAK